MPSTRRRDFLSLLGGAAAAWPVRVKAQQPSTPVIGFIRSSSLADSTRPRDRVPQRSEGNRVRGGPERRDRISLCRQPI